MGAHQSVTSAVRTVGKSLVADAANLSDEADGVAGRLTDIQDSQLVSRCFYVDFFRASQAIYGQNVNNALQEVQLRVVSLIRANIYDLTDCIAYPVGSREALQQIVDNLSTPPDWSGTMKIFKTILKDLHALMNSLAYLERIAQLQFDSLNVQWREASRLIGRLRCTCPLLQALLRVD